MDQGNDHCKRAWQRETPEAPLRRGSERSRGMRICVASPGERPPGKILGRYPIGRQVAALARKIERIPLQVTLLSEIGTRRRIVRTIVREQKSPELIEVIRRIVGVG